MSPLLTVLTIGLILRVTRLIVSDQITFKAREWLVLKLGPRNPFAYLVSCSWCMSIWVGAGIAVAAYFWADQRWWFFVALAGTASLLAGWAARWLDPYDDEDED